MSTDPQSLHLMELLCARLCHDLAGPVGAASAGAELFEDGAGNADGETLALVAASASSAAVRLKYFRAAFGPAPSAAQATIALRDLINSYLKTHVSVSVPGIILQWNVDVPHLTGSESRLLLNLVLLAKETLPRGGRMQIQKPTTGLEIIVQGEPASLSDEVRAVLGGQPPAGSKGAQAALLQRLASAVGMGLRHVIGPQGLHLMIHPA